MEIKYYTTSSGRSPVGEFISCLAADTRARFLNAVTRLADGEKLAMPLSRNLSSIWHGLHELRIKDAQGQYRFFYYIKVGEAICFVHAIKKKSQNLLREDVETVIRRIKEI